jgi:hypothetical protein
MWQCGAAAIDIKDASGTTTHWVLEFGSPRVLEKNYRWNANLLKAGDNITADGWLVESECGAVVVGCTYLLPPLSSGGALVVQP